MLNLTLCFFIKPIILLTRRLLELILFCNFSVKNLLLNFKPIELFLPVQLIIKKLCKLEADSLDFYNYKKTIEKYTKEDYENN